MQIKLVRESLNPRISVEEFINWFEGIYNANPAVSWEWVLGALENDEYSSNEELKEYFMKEDDNISEELVDELLAYREYFLDFRYSPTFRCMRAKLINESIKHLTPQDITPESNLTNALAEMECIERTNPRYALIEDKKRVTNIINLLTELDFVVIFNFTEIFNAYSVILIDYKNQYSATFRGYYVPINYDQTYMGLELTQKKLAPGQKKPDHLKATTDLKEIKNFLLQFKGSYSGSL